ncbi:MAG TPA: hypothetical protein PKC28_01645 [Bdellovibrionales bacterium]|nr:hypothetical protein [Bdellovibrionales bacterium]
MKAMNAYRRCHVCGTTCEEKSQIRRCTKCGKSFAPFFYFDDKFSPVLNAGGMRPPDLAGQWRPIHGLTAYWQPD